MPSHPQQDRHIDHDELARRLTSALDEWRAAHDELTRELTAAQGDLDQWRAAHRSLATMLGATDRGRDHCDATLIIAAIKHVFHITRITMESDATAVQIVTADGNVHHVLIANLMNNETA